MHYWYALQVKRGEELWLTEQLSKSGYECFCPTYVVTKRVSRHAKKMEKVARPLFDKYLFMYLDRDFQLWGDIINIRDVDGFISAGGFPLPIRAEVIEIIRRDCEVGVYNEKGLEGAIRKGDKVSIVGSHPFSGFVAEFVGATGRRANVELKLFGRITTVELPTALIERIS